MKSHMFTSIITALVIVAFNKVAVSNGDQCPLGDLSLKECLRYQIEKHKLPNDEQVKPLSYCSFKQLQREGKLSEADADELITFAQRNGNPILFKPIGEAKLPRWDQYSLNFLWINREKLKDDGHLIGDNNALLMEKIIAPVKDWHTKQPGASINIWYDSAMLINAATAVQRTLSVLSENGVDVSKVALRDIRETKIAIDHPELFDSRRHVFFRVDIAKAVAADHVLRVDNLPYVVTIDSDIVAIMREQLFDKKTMDQIQDLGYVMGKAYPKGWENSFIILHNNVQQQTLDQHFTIVIGRTIEKARTLLKKNPEDPFEPQMAFRNYYQDRGVPGFREEAREQYFDRAFLMDDWKERRRAEADYLKKMLEKDMILPSSQFGSPAYSAELINKLREALVGPEGCN